jgi:5-oxoprolinase (ATP-hydrolysing)
MRSTFSQSCSGPALTKGQTIAGGSGAGPGWHGTSGVHTHITNTRIGDVELLERRYPVLVHRFGLREGSGGAGRWRGGDGCVRDFEVTEGMQVSILSEVRSVVDRAWREC